MKIKRLREIFRRWSIIVGVTWLALSLTSCESIGPAAIRGGRTDYNEAIRTTEAEQILLNIIRLRHNDQPWVLEISSIASKIELTAALTGETGFKEPMRNTAKVGAGLSYAEKPTIIYQPLRGKDFVLQLLTPIDLGTILLLRLTGWEIDDILRVFANRMNGVPNAPTGGDSTPEGIPEYTEFLKVVEALDELEDNGAIILAAGQEKDQIVDYRKGSKRASDRSKRQRREKKEDKKNPDIKLSKSGTVNIKTKDGLSISEKGDVKVKIKDKDSEERRQDGQRKRRDPSQLARLDELVIVVLPKARDTQEFRDLVRILDLNPDAESYKLRLGLVPGGPEEIVIETRPILSAMFYLGQNVDIPEPVEEAGWVHFNRDEAGQPFDWNKVHEGLFRVRSATTRPKNAFTSVKYRGYWYYIDSTDIDTRETLTMISIVFALKAGGHPSIPPLLTLPVD